MDISHQFSVHGDVVAVPGPGIQHVRGRIASLDGTKSHTVVGAAQVLLGLDVDSAFPLSVLPWGIQTSFRRHFAKGDVCTPVPSSRWACCNTLQSLNELGQSLVLCVAVSEISVVSFPNVAAVPQNELRRFRRCGGVGLMETSECHCTGMPSIASSSWYT